MPPLPEQPPVVPWPEWYERERYYKPGHILFSGPTQSGKTRACREVVRLRSFVTVVGTKVKDPSLDAYVAEGYLRIEHWPPTRQDIKRATQPDGSVRLILWPRIRTRADLRKPETKALFARFLDYIFIEGEWTVVIDEGLWFSASTGLNLGLALGDIAYGGASNGIKLYVLVQRPANVPPVVWTSVSQAILFKSGRTDDIRELASLGTYDPKDVAVAIRRLQLFQFLDLPVRAQAEWALSTVE